jgi:3-phytase
VPSAAPVSRVSLLFLASAGALAGLSLAGCAGPTAGGGGFANAVVHPAAETDATRSDDDAADDPAIWVHPSDPSRSLVLGSDKRAGLGVHTLDGTRVAFLPVGPINNVDTAVLGTQGGAVHIAAGTARQPNAVFVWTIDARTGTLTRADSGGIRSTLPDVYGFALARLGDETLALVTSKAGQLEAITLRHAAGAVSASARVTIAVGGQLEGVVADAGHDALYIGEEGVGIWRYALLRDAAGRIDWEETASNRRLIDTCRDTQGAGNLTSDVEGLTIWAPRGTGAGYLIASSQGDDRYCVYERAEPNAFVGSFRIAGRDGIDGVTHTDGIDATAAPTGPSFPRGLFVVQDDDNSPERQNFKIVDWREIERALLHR